MANPNTPFGFRPIIRAGGAPFSVTAYGKPSTDPNAIYAFDLVQKVQAAIPLPEAALLVNLPGVQTGYVGTPGTTLWLGASLAYGAPSTATVHPVADEPDVLYLVQASTGLAISTAGHVGKNANVSLSLAGNTRSRMSRMTADSATIAAAASLDLRILRVAMIPPNAEGDSAMLEVSINKHWSIGGAAVVTPPPAGFSARYMASSIVPVANGAALSTWPDSSGNGYDATQATSANQPQYVTAGQTIAGLQPGVWFGAGTANMNGAGAGGNAQQFFTLPIGLQTNLVNCTIFVIGESGFSAEQYGPMVGLGQNSGIGPANFQNSLGFHKAGAWTPLSVTNLPTGPFAVCLESTAAAVTLTTEYSASSASGSAALALAGGAIGSAYAAAASGGSAPFNCYQGMLQEILIYPGTITPAQKAALFAYAAAQYGTATAKRPYNLIWYGNSVFLEWGAQTNGGMTALAAKNAATSYARMNGINTGILGSSFTQQLANVNYTKSLYDPSATKNIVCLYDGDTDLTGNGLTASQIYNEQLQLCQALQSVGFKVVSSSLTNHAYTGAQLTTFNQYNALLRATPIGDAFADIASDPVFANYNAAYMSDTSHPNNAGHAVMAPYFIAAIQSILNAAPAPLAITSNAFPSGNVGTAYSASQTASGGATPYAYSATGLPAGLSISATTGAITGTPTTAGGPTAVTVTVTDSTTPTHQTASTSGLTITINPSTGGGAGGTISVVHSNNPADITGSSGTYTIAATTAGNAVILVFNFRNSATDSITSITGLGTATQVPGARSVSTADGRTSDMWQCLNVPGGVTSVTINQTGTGTITVIGTEVATTIGHLAFDAASATTNANGSTATCTGAPITTTGTKGFVMCYVASLAFTFGAVSPPLVDSGLQDLHGNPYYYALNLAPQAFTPTVQVTGFPGAYHFSTGAWTTV